MGTKTITCTLPQVFFIDGSIPRKLVLREKLIDDLHLGIIIVGLGKGN